MTELDPASFRYRIVDGTGRYAECSHEDFNILSAGATLAMYCDDGIIRRWRKSGDNPHTPLFECVPVEAEPVKTIHEAVEAEAAASALLIHRADTRREQAAADVLARRAKAADEAVDVTISDGRWVAKLPKVVHEHRVTRHFTLPSLPLVGRASDKPRLRNWFWWPGKEQWTSRAPSNKQWEAPDPALAAAHAHFIERKSVRVVPDASPETGFDHAGWRKNTAGEIAFYPAHASATSEDENMGYLRSQNAGEVLFAAKRDAFREGSRDSMSEAVSAMGIGSNTVGSPHPTMGEDAPHEVTAYVPTLALVADNADAIDTYARELCVRLAALTDRLIGEQPRVDVEMANFPPGEIGRLAGSLCQVRQALSFIAAECDRIENALGRAG